MYSTRSVSLFKIVEVKIFNIYTYMSILYILYIYIYICTYNTYIYIYPIWCHHSLLVNSNMFDAQKSPKPNPVVNEFPALNDLSVEKSSLLLSLDSDPTKFYLIFSKIGHNTPHILKSNYLSPTVHPMKNHQMFYIDSHSPGGCVWKCRVPQKKPMVLLIIIPFLNGYFIGNINPTFSGPNPFQYSTLTVHPMKNHQMFSHSPAIHQPFTRSFMLQSHPESHPIPSSLPRVTHGRQDLIHLPAPRVHVQTQRGDHVAHLLGEGWMEGWSSKKWRENGQWPFQDPIDGGTLVPYFGPYFGASLQFRFQEWPLKWWKNWNAGCIWMWVKMEDLILGTTDVNVSLV